MNKKVSVLHIITWLDVGGAQDNTLTTIELANRNKYVVSFASGQGGDYTSRAVEASQQFFTINTLRRDTVSYTHLTLPTTPYV